MIRIRCKRVPAGTLISLLVSRLFFLHFAQVPCVKMANIAHYDHQSSLSKASVEPIIITKSDISRFAPIDEKNVVYGERSATVEFVSSQWKNVTNRARYIMNEDGIAVLVGAPSAPMTSNVEEQITDPVNHDIDSLQQSYHYDPAITPTVIAGKLLVQSRHNLKQQVEKSKADEEAQSMALYYQIELLENHFSRLESSFYLAMDNQHVSLADDWVPIELESDDSLEEKIAEYDSLQQQIINDLTSQNQSHLDRINNLKWKMRRSEVNVLAWKRRREASFLFKNNSSFSTT